MRKENIITIIDDEKELTFKVKQMSALKQERWINRALILLTGTKSLGSILTGLSLDNVQHKIKNFNFDSLLDVLGKLEYEKIEPLYNELLECCSYVPNSNNLNFATQLNTSNVDSIIADVKTLYKLRMEALKINFAFFGQGAKSPSRKKADVVITKRM